MGDISSKQSIKQARRLISPLISYSGTANAYTKMCVTHKKYNKYSNVKN